ncbi:EthD family reductase [Streptomyces shenzhenensis]|uniref:EthD family reductase n=1 Tax=Streptomyces shenzhenensis TaxID=943815 RepID=UPI00381ECBE2
MYDIFVLYQRPEDQEDFDKHYRTVHAPLVEAMPLVREFTWGPVAGAGDGTPYLVARMTYATQDDAERSLSSPEGQAAVADLGSFAGAGVLILNSVRTSTWQR